MAHIIIYKKKRMCREEAGWLPKFPRVKKNLLGRLQCCSGEGDGSWWPAEQHINKPRSLRKGSHWALIPIGSPRLLIYLFICLLFFYGCRALGDMPLTMAPHQRNSKLCGTTALLSLFGRRHTTYLGGNGGATLV